MQMQFGWSHCLLTTITCAVLAHSVPPGFPSSGNGLWYTDPAISWEWEYLPVGNGYLATMLPGGTVQESTQLNIESLWSGGPFQDSSYNGGNPQLSQQASLAANMERIREAIFANGSISNIEELMTDAGAYGSYAGAGYLLATLDIVGSVMNYTRWLDLDEATTGTTWSQDGVTFFRETFCSHPIRACVQYLNSTATLPSLTYAYAAQPEGGLPTPNVTCLNNSTLSIRGYVFNPGMLYEIQAQVATTGGTVSCAVVPGSSSPNATINVTSASEAWITWIGDTDYNMAAGSAAFNYSFQGPDPHNNLVALLASANIGSTSYNIVRVEHIADYQSIMGLFSLSLGQTPDVSTPTDQIVASYKTNVGNTYLEWLAFNFGRYLLASSARGTLPANLQGKWADRSTNAWPADYHANINLQMSYWSAEITNMNVVSSLFDYMENTWTPRGAYTASVLYNISSGWVTHDEMNIFGHTGMKLNDAGPADYPEANAWMGAASFHLEKLVDDLYYNDNTLVTAPCNSPEQNVITFGCAHSQQVIWQLFNAIEKGYEAAGDTDIIFLNSVKFKRAQMDKGIRIGSWGQLQEWKIDMDSSTSTHRHLSHLVGLYPGYTIASYDAALQGGLSVDGTSHNYSKPQVLQAAETSLLHRGIGTGTDADSGWEKAWRAAAWAQLGNNSEFHAELTYTIQRNFAPNLLDLYGPGSSIFQMDANSGYSAALLNGLLQVPDVASIDTPLQVTLLPALPASWATGSISGARLRGGISLDLSWNGGKLTSATFSVDATINGRQRQVIVNYGGTVIGEFTSNDAIVYTVEG